MKCGQALASEDSNLTCEDLSVGLRKLVERQPTHLFSPHYNLSTICSMTVMLVQK